MICKPCFLAVVLSLAMGTAAADEREQLLELKTTTRNLIEVLVEEGVISREKADRLLERAQQKTAAELKQREREQAQPSREVVRVPYVPDFVRDEIRDQVRSELREDVVNDVMAQAKNERWGVPEALPEWISRIKFKGDIRLRGEADLFDSTNDEFAYLDFNRINAAGGAGKTDDPFLNVSSDRYRARARVRLGMDAKVSNDTKVGLRLSSGNTRDPVSTNQTLGNYGNRWQMVLDRAYLQHDDYDLDGYKWLTLTGGRIPNPWLSTDLVWDRDLGFEGFAATYRKSLTGSSSLMDIDENTRSLFLTLGAFPLAETELSSRDKWLFGAQLGSEFKFNDQSTFKLGLAYYDYYNITGKRNSFGSTKYNFTAPQFMQKGNTLFDIYNGTDADANLYALAADYKEINFTAAMDIARFAPTHVIVTADWVKNIGFDSGDVQQRTGVPVSAKTTGYQLQLAVGWPQVMKARDWQLFGAYKYLERDAVLDAFTDSDFHLGGTDAKGWILGGSYGLGDQTWLTGRWLSANEIDGPKLRIDVFQLDINAKF